MKVKVYQSLDRVIIYYVIKEWINFTEEIKDNKYPWPKTRPKESTNKTS